MRDVYRDVVKVLDSSLADEDIYGYFDKIASDPSSFGEEDLGSLSIYHSQEVEVPNKRYYAIRIASYFHGLDNNLTSAADFRENVTAVGNMNQVVNLSRRVSHHKYLTSV